MPLSSKLFKNDPKLQACLISDPDHVIPGSKGEHVSKIQQALFLTNGASINTNELGEMRYGTSTANAVLAFKGSPRNILAPGEIVPNNIVGKKTIARLDSEMFVIENPSVTLEMEFGSISWIDPRPNPVRKVVDGINFNPNWIPKAALGLMAVSNIAPPDTVNNFAAYKSSKDFRSMTFCRLRIDISGITNTAVVTLLNSFAEGGFTPPFSIQKLKDNGVEFGLGDETVLKSNIPAIMTGFLPGETSSVSSVQIGARHPNTAIDNVPADRQVIFNALVKVRANGDEDAVGVQPDPGVPYHVPWVWCEMLVTYDAARRQLAVYGRGSLFPSHAWFANTHRVAAVTQSFDTSFPVYPSTKLLRESDMILTSFFKQGAPATGSQTTLASESRLTGSVETHPNTAPGGKTVVEIVIM
jgi:hypothetical protein